MSSSQTLWWTTSRPHGAAKLQQADDIEAGGVDMVCATNVMHFPDPQEDAMATIARQLRPGGTPAGRLSRHSLARCASTTATCRIYGPASATREAVSS